MKDTFDKVEEAHYFLSCMEEDLINVARFKFNLSAFLSASRSVTFILQKEFKNTEGFASWYKRKQAEFSTNKLFIFFNEKRNFSIHEKSIPLRKEVQITYQDHLALSDKMTAFVLHSNGSSEIREGEIGNPDPKESNIKDSKDVKHLWFFDDMPDKDLISLCKTYLEIVEQVVLDCQAKFG